MIGALLGHSNVQTTARYAHLADDPVRIAARNIANSIAAAMRRKPAPNGVGLDVPSRAGARSRIFNQHLPRSA
jgi:hypothetical protein